MVEGGKEQVQAKRVVGNLRTEVGRSLSLLWNQRQYEGNASLPLTGHKQDL